MSCVVFNRCNLYFLFFCILINIFYPYHYAFSLVSPRKFIENLIYDSCDIVDKNNIVDESVLIVLSDRIGASFDYYNILNYVFGHTVIATASETEMNDIIEQYKIYLMYNYIPTLKRCGEYKFHVIRSIDISKVTHIVSTKFEISDNSIFIDYKLRLVSDRFLIYDIVLGGSSVFSQHRSEFSAFIKDVDNIRDLIKLLKEINNKLYNTMYKNNY